MRALWKPLVAGGTAIALTLSAAVSPAQAAVTHDQGVYSYRTDSDAGHLASATIDTTNNGRAELTWNSPAGALFTRLNAHVYLNDISQLNDAPLARSWSENGADYVELRNNDPAGTGMEILRTYRFDGTSATLTVRTRNTSTRTQKLQVDLTHAGTYTSPKFHAVPGLSPIVAKSTSPDYDVTVDFSGDPQSTGFSGGGVWSDAKYGAEGTKAYQGEGGARLQGGRWFRPIEPGETFTGSVTVTAAPPADFEDNDHDGIPDDWERGGFSPAGYNERLDLARWGASPDTPDVFLQLNWMKPEVDSTSCAPGGRYVRSADGYANFLECAEANKNEYQPSKKSLDELVSLFKAKGINLHIDAGSWYNTFTTRPEEMKGGPTVPYKYPYYDAESLIEPTLAADRTDYLGAREAVFRLGIIGDRLLEGDYSTGVATTPGGSFYVAKQSTMTSDEQVRNTILHELGHNLGLTHSGTHKAAENKQLNNLPNYVSTMNYLYQFSHFEYSNQEFRSGGPLPNICLTKSCYSGSYTVPADWPNITLADGILGRFDGSTGAPGGPGGEPDIQRDFHREDAAIRELEVNAAEANNTKGGFRLVEVEGHRNGIIPVLGDNYLTGEITNRGRNPQTFTVEAVYPNGTSWRQGFRVDGIPRDLPADDSTNPTAGKLPVTIPLQVESGFAGTSMPVTIRVYNEAGVEQYNETLKIPVLDYTAEELARVLDEVLADPAASPEVKAAARETTERLDRSNNGSGHGSQPSQPNPPLTRPTVPVKPATDPLRQPGSSSADGSSTDGSSAEGSSTSDNLPLIIGGSIVGLLALLLAAGVGWFFGQQQR